MTWLEPEWAASETGPLRGLRVLDFSTLLPGPYATQILGDLGADVIKVEPPRGDEARRFPSGLFPVANRNKRGIVANLKLDADRRRCLELAAAADFVLESWRPGVAARLGVGYEDIKRENPDVIYCSISGYGQSGPNRDRPGHDLNFLAASGGLAFSAHWGEAPRRSGVPVADLAGSTHAAIAMLSALRERELSGEGCHLDVSITDATMAFVSPRGGPSFRVRDEQRLGVYAVNDVYVAGDGERIAIAAVETKFWQALREALALESPELLDTRFDTEDGRREYGDELQGLLRDIFRCRSAEEWVRLLSARDIPVDRILDLEQAAHSSQAAARKIVCRLGGEEQVVFPVHRDGHVLGNFRSPAPGLGEHDEALLGVR